MARSRNIKPGFFKNEDLVELGFATRLLFAGLWTIADREGRMEDRPKRIKMEVFPADDVNITEMLQELHDAKFVQRYEVNGEKYVQIANWAKHQNPHNTEKASTIPDINGALTVKAPSGHGKPQVEDGGNLADSLIPDSLEKERPAAVAASSPIRLLRPACPHRALIELYGRFLPMLSQPKPELWTGANADAMKARWQWVLAAKRSSGERYAENEEQALDWFSRFFAHVEQSDFLTGRNGKWTKCSLAWLMNAANFAKVVEGNFHDKEYA